ncbi:biotin--[acetyl-CoA-carboxylase] ligase [Primorskyibacter sp. 2E107]|uniref:biotin--[acetyl-CoA-carboxylase] ligase n=1 Tax=Primorskyibacter sp. 2E107 TaxID=3403458 RepID=UPI003AF94DE8
MAWPEGYGRRVLAEVDSTNAEGARIAGTLAGPEWILGLRQTAARGRRGRAWVNPPGNFAASLVMRPSEAPEVVALRSFVASLALYDAVSAVVGDATGLALKWPNDVLLHGGKLAGILLESVAGHLVIGIGVNLIAAPGAELVEPEAVQPVSLLAETGRRVAPEALFEALAASYALREAAFVAYGFAPIREAWLSHAARIGEEIVARTGSSEHRGTFETVDERGNLVLKTSEARRAIAAADVFF